MKMEDDNEGDDGIAKWCERKKKSVISMHNWEHIMQTQVVQLTRIRPWELN